MWRKLRCIKSLTSVPWTTSLSRCGFSVPASPYTQYRRKRQTFPHLPPLCPTYSRVTMPVDSPPSRGDPSYPSGCRYSLFIARSFASSRSRARVYSRRRRTTGLRNPALSPQTSSLGFYFLLFPVPPTEDSLWHGPSTQCEVGVNVCVDCQRTNAQLPSPISIALHANLPPAR